MINSFDKPNIEAEIIENPADAISNNNDHQVIANPINTLLLLSSATLGLSLIKLGTTCMIVDPNDDRGLFTSGLVLMKIGASLPLVSVLVEPAMRCCKRLRNEDHAQGAQTQIGM